MIERGIHRKKVWKKGWRIGGRKRRKTERHKKKEIKRKKETKKERQADRQTDRQKDRKKRKMKKPTHVLLFHQCSIPDHQNLVDRAFRCQCSHRKEIRTTPATASNRVETF